MRAKGDKVSRLHAMDRFEMHNEKVRFLDTLAVLLGCAGSIGGHLPDGKYPDVLRIDTKRGILFIGDAKNTETPGCAETQIRILGYLKWLATYCTARKGLGVFAICFGNATDALNWKQAVIMLAHEVGLCCAESGLERFGKGVNVMWFTFNCSNPNSQDESCATNN
jgi:hypothetical protein